MGSSLFGAQPLEAFKSDIAGFLPPLPLQSALRQARYVLITRTHPVFAMR
jgi:hypothetical protein